MMRFTAILAFTAACLLTLPAYPAGGILPGIGTETDPYLIEDFADFQTFCGDSSYWAAGIYTRLTNDLDLDPNLPGRQIYTRAPIAYDLDTNYGFDGIPYQGHFDGDGHIINNLTLKGKSYCGLFGRTDSGAEIKNIELNNVSFLEPGGYCGGLCGYNYDGNISNCHVSCSIPGGGSLGGLCGANQKGTITDCKAIASISGYADIGGLVGNNIDGTISSSCAAVSIEGYEHIGGLVGFHKGELHNCYATGLVSGEYYVAGLAVHEFYPIIKNCYAACIVNITGDYSFCDRIYDECTMYYGGLTASFSYGAYYTVDGCFWDMQISSQTGSNGGRGLTTPQMKSVSTFQNAGWSGNEWVMLDGQDYPRLAWENTGYPPIPPAEPVPLNGIGTETNPYQVWTADEFVLLSWHSEILDSHINLMSDIDLTGKSIYSIGDIFPFTGVFDGGGHTISNPTMVQPGNYFVGLFAQTGKGGEIRNLNVTNADITGGSRVGIIVGSNWSKVTNCHVSGTVYATSNYSGGISGDNIGYRDDGGSLLGGKIKNCSMAGSVSGVYRVGGLVGMNEEGIVSQSHATGSVFGKGDVGGLAGMIYWWGSVENCWANSSVTAMKYSVGGLIGVCNGWIYSCYAAGAVFAEGQKHSDNIGVGGLVGYNSHGDIYDSYTTASVSSVCCVIGGFAGVNDDGIITNCYAMGKLTYQCSGGFIGECNGGAIRKCFWNIETTGETVGTTYGCSDPLILIGLTTAQMQDPDTFMTEEWDYVNEETNGRMDIWYQPPGSYPKLFWQAMDGDADYDQDVDAADAARFVSWWLTDQGDMPSDQRLHCDYNFDEIVNLADSALLAKNWLHWVIPGDLAEPWGVDIIDFHRFAAAWNAARTDQSWDESCNLDYAPGGESTIDLTDLDILLTYWLTGR